MKIRNVKIDNLKGILIFLVVLAHCLFSYNYYNNEFILKIVNFIYSFHMPLFIIASGYLSKKQSKNNNFKLLLLFILLNFSYIIYDLFLYGELDLFDIKYSSWYLPIIFLYRIILGNQKIKNIVINNKKIIFYLFFILSIISGYFYIFQKYFTILRFFSFFIFFLFGFLLDLNKIKLSYHKSLRGILILFFIIISLIIIFPFDLSFFMSRTYNNNIEPLLRTIFYIINIKLFLYLYILIPEKEIYILTNMGKNSLIIYIFHRIFALIITDLFILTDYFIPIAILLSFSLCILFNNSKLNKFVNYVFDKLYFYFTNNKFKFIVSNVIVFLVIFCISYSNEFISYFKKIETINYDEIEKIDNSIVIGFVGDLILLEDQVRNSYINGEYNFDYMFKYTKKYFDSTDYMIGILEGPVDDSKEYSIGNYNDGKELRLNYPTAFLESIKKSGIDLVSISNNHLLDKGLDSAYNTINNLNYFDLDYIGSYKNGEDKNKKIINVYDLKIGILAYTYGINYHNEDELLTKYNSLTNYLCDSTSKNFSKIKKQVEQDFQYLKNNNVDLILVLPHMGTQFINNEDKYQKTWNKIFVENGADIILGDHSHSVQPIYYKNNSIVINSPGNYVNSYTGYDGDISMMIKIYIDRDTKKINCLSVIPMLAQKDNNFGYYPIPIYEYYNDNNLRNIKVKHLNRIEYTTSFVTKNSINKSISYIESEYFYFPNNEYKKQNNYVFKLNENDKKSIMYKKINQHDNICFIGDSITEGSFNSFHPWYEPFKEIFLNKNYINISKSSYTSYDVINNFSNKIMNSNCELFIINIGTNDIRYNLTTKEEFINNINKILSFTNSKDVILLAPWQTTKYDKKLQSDTEKKINLYNEYNLELNKLADNYDSIYYIDPNSYIKSAFKENGEKTYLYDGVHPNNNIGIKLYAFSTFRN